jgi:ribonuclease BN (tRNA processing enzyme)
MKADHMPAEDIGRIAEEAGVKTLVLSHLAPAIDSITDDTWREPVAKYFKDDILVGKDLLVSGARYRINVRSDPDGCDPLPSRSI